MPNQDAGSGVDRQGYAVPSPWPAIWRDTGLGQLFHLRPEDQQSMFRVFAAHAAPATILMFNAGFGRGEAIGSYRGDPLYHASLDASEYATLLTDSGFELIEHSINDPAKGGRIFWLARAA